MATKRLYRSKDGQIFGVCKGISEWRDLPVEPVRLITFFTIVFTGFFPGAVIYLILALILPVNPYGQTDNASRSSQRPSETYSTNRPQHDDLKAEYERLKKKVEQMEEEMFDKERDWDSRFHEGN